MEDAVRTSMKRAPTGREDGTNEAGLQLGLEECVEFNCGSPTPPVSPVTHLLIKAINKSCRVMSCEEPCEAPD